ncbi:hypothetical protein BDB01DRAFT_803693 [Pilobolus umbonatus]|nr:hypothetical protein BDB01DRAFT_803693 [Pilobolus umbonatus]
MGNLSRDLDRALDDIISHHGRGQPRNDSRPSTSQYRGRGRGGRVNERAGQRMNERLGERHDGRMSKGLRKPMRQQGNKIIGPVISRYSQRERQLSGDSRYPPRETSGYREYSPRESPRFPPREEMRVREESGRIDPASIIITKAVKPTVSPKQPVRQEMDQGRTKQPDFTLMKSEPADTRSYQDNNRQYQDRQYQDKQYQNNSNRSYQDNNRSYRDNIPYQDSSNNNRPYPPAANTPKRNIVLICNLDPRATAEDVGEACRMFGPIISCDMLMDAMQRPLSEAEVEFLYPESAKECVANLDNQLADGRILHAKLQDTVTPSIVPRYSSKTVDPSKVQYTNYSRYMS